MRYHCATPALFDGKWILWSLETQVKVTRQKGFCETSSPRYGAHLAKAGVPNRSPDGVLKPNNGVFSFPDFHSIVVAWLKAKYKIDVLLPCFINCHCPLSDEPPGLRLTRHQSGPNHNLDQPHRGLLGVGKIRRRQNHLGIRLVGKLTGPKALLEIALSLLGRVRPMVSGDKLFSQS